MLPVTSTPPLVAGYTAAIRLSNVDFPDDGSLRRLKLF